MLLLSAKTLALTTESKHSSFSQAYLAMLLHSSSVVLHQKSWLAWAWFTTAEEDARSVYQANSCTAQHSNS